MFLPVCCISETEQFEDSKTLCPKIKVAKNVTNFSPLAAKVRVMTQKKKKKQFGVNRNLGVGYNLI